MVSAVCLNFKFHFSSGNTTSIDNVTTPQGTRVDTAHCSCLPDDSFIHFEAAVVKPCFDVARASDQIVCASELLDTCVSCCFISSLTVSWVYTLSSASATPGVSSSPLQRHFLALLALKTPPGRPGKCKLF